MSTVRTLIVQALEEIGVARNDRTFRARDGDVALERLNTIVAGIFGQGVGENLKDQAITSAETVLANTRAVVSTHSAAFTITLPEEPDNGARFQLVDSAAGFAARPVTVNPNGRLIEGATASIAASTNGYNRTWFYRADLADWKRISALVLTDEFPFPLEYDDAFAIQLALRLAPRFGKSISQESVAASQRALSGLRAKFRQRVVTRADTAVLNLSVQATGRGVFDIENT